MHKQKEEDKAKDKLVLKMDKLLQALEVVVEGVQVFKEKDQLLEEEQDLDKLVHQLMEILQHQLLEDKVVVVELPKQEVKLLLEKDLEQDKEQVKHKEINLLLLVQEEVVDQDKPQEVVEDKVDKLHLMDKTNAI